MIGFDQPFLKLYSADPIKSSETFHFGACNVTAVATVAQLRFCCRVNNQGTFDAKLC